ncbi:S8 family serine peptidase (plasmid) [Niallia taxi]|uniref:S8 family serine peptidase n=1 Tax=Niallia taxi TaxID=2499688 RepID=UPI002934B43F|nr:S8 family serine peptidase [Niallia taxi]WOD65645.1 S8 family serine peptidase [Niallia taxi]
MKKYYVFTACLLITFIFLIIYGSKGDSNPLDKRKTKVNQEESYNWGFDAIKYYKEKPSESKIKVAVLDSGIFPHDDLSGKITKALNTFNNQPLEDEYGHGTAVAGIITANDNNNGITGVSQNIELYNVKVLDKNGKGKIENLIKGIEWCIAERVDIINISFGVQIDDRQLKKTIDDAINKGIIIVAAAGNTYGFGVDFPAKYENVLSINSVNTKLKRTSSAAKGKIDFSAPGDKIFSTSNDGKYEYFSGTSFSTAFATGIIARKLVKFGPIKSHSSYIEFMQIIRQSVIQKEPIKDYGYGILIVEEEE